MLIVAVIIGGPTATTLATVDAYSLATAVIKRQVTVLVVGLGDGATIVSFHATIARRVCRTRAYVLYAHQGFGGLHAPWSVVRCAHFA